MSMMGVGRVLRALPATGQQRLLRREGGRKERKDMSILKGAESCYAYSLTTAESKFPKKCLPADPLQNPG